MIIERHAVRALLLNPQNELLLMKIAEPKSGRSFWLAPGGGIDAGETHSDCLRREIFEETGLTEFEIGPEVWRREHQFMWDGRTMLQRERFYLVRTPRFEPTARHMPDEIERTTFGGYRWWPAADIRRSSESFAPRRLAHLLHALLEDGPPPEPIFISD